MLIKKLENKNVMFYSSNDETQAEGFNISGQEVSTYRDLDILSIGSFYIKWVAPDELYLDSGGGAVQFTGTKTELIQELSDNFFFTVVSGGGGGVEQVIAGDNVTVTGTTANPVVNSFPDSTQTDGMISGAVITTGNQWTTIYTFGIDIDTWWDYDFKVNAKRIDGVGLYKRKREALALNNGGLLQERASTDVTVRVGSVSGFLSVREIIVGPDILIQVRGASGQSYDWTINGSYGIENL